MLNHIHEKWFTQDLLEDIKVQHCEDLVFTGDNNGNPVGVVVRKGGGEPDLNGAVVCKVIRPDMVTVEFSGTLDGAKVSAILPKTALAYPGIIAVLLQLVSDTDTLTVMKALFTAELGETDVKVVPEGTVPDLPQLLAKLDEMTQGTTRANAAAEAAESAAGTANTAADNATSATSAANTAANAANSAANSANSAASAANQAAASVPQFLMDTLFDWYMEEHSGQVTPFTKIESATITGTNLASEIVFDPDTIHYSGGATISGTQAMYSISNIVLANPDAKIGMVSYQKVSGSGTLEVGKRENTATILFTLSGSELIGRLSVPIQYTHGGKTYTTTYQLTITVTKAS